MTGRATGAQSGTGPWDRDRGWTLPPGSTSSVSVLRKCWPQYHHLTFSGLNKYFGWLYIFRFPPSSGWSVQPADGGGGGHGCNVVRGNHVTSCMYHLSTFWQENLLINLKNDPKCCWVLSWRSEMFVSAIILYQHPSNKSSITASSYLIFGIRIQTQV